MLAALTPLSTDHEPVALSALGIQLSRSQPGFDTRVYGRRTLSELVRELPSIAVVKKDGTLFARPARSPR